MTTTVTITTHDWPVDLAMTDLQGTPTGETRLVTHRHKVAPHSTHHEYVHSTRILTVTELAVPQSEVKAGD